MELSVALVRRVRTAHTTVLLLIMGLVGVGILLQSLDVQRRFENHTGSSNQLRDCYRDLGRAYHRLRPRDSSPEGEAFRTRHWWLMAALVRALDIGQARSTPLAGQRLPLRVLPSVRAGAGHGGRGSGGGHRGAVGAQHHRPATDGGGQRRGRPTPTPVRPARGQSGAVVRRR
ncbi:hypothetical protein FJT64_020729 [Amphibalanus amphitrite]|uniref:Uncharacterized protein n=1 Tax=Amphibalanus amphitrite TaxID=1232801 RepID=A0A6A4X0N6_AMPAM|nr:hypothetical protein FJT64_020729 [Amphibalanus amphitrite]